MAKVFIGVGHGGSDPGAVANGFKEEDLNLAIALACRDELKRHGVTVGISRTKDEEDTLSMEVAECNEFAPDLAVEIHNNAGGGDGVEIYHRISGGTSKILAQNVLNEIVVIGQNSRGLKTRKDENGNDYYGWIRRTIAPAILIECAFLDSKDIEIIDTALEQRYMGTAIAKGILKTLGIAWKAETATTTTTSAPTTTATIKTGDLVTISSGAKYYTGANLPAWVKNLKWYVASVSGDRAVLGKDESGKYNIVSPINTAYLSVVKATASKQPAIAVGSTVKLKDGAKTYDGKSLASFVHKRNHKVKEIKGDRVVITYLGIVIAAVKLSDLTLVK